MMVLLFTVGVAGIAVVVGEVDEKVGTGMEASDGFSAQPLKTRLNSRTQKIM